MDTVGYNKPLYILAFDHRNTFYAHMFKVPSEQVNPEQQAKITDFKHVIFEAVKKSLSTIPLAEAAILVEEQYGDAVLKEASEMGMRTILTVEKTGQKEFTFEFGEQFAEHIEKYKPTFAKVLIKYNPSDPEDMRQRQQVGLKRISDYCHANGYKFLLEVLVGATEQQLKDAGGDAAAYDKNLRPALTIQVVKELQDSGVEPDIWKMEGLESRVDYENVVGQMQAGGRNGVSLVILGRGATEPKVEEWLRNGASVPGVVGFAVGRTIFWDALMAYNSGTMTRDQAVDTISSKFLHFYTVFKDSLKA